MRGRYFRGPGARRLLALVLLWTQACLSSAAHAASPGAASVVLIVFEPNSEALSLRLRQEIEALGFRVQLDPEASPAGSLEELALAAEALAAIRVKSLAAGGVEMTVLDRTTGKTVHRDLARVVATDPGEELIATRTVELFRASLMELNADHPSRGTVTAPTQAVALVEHEQEAQVRRRSGTVSISAGPGVLLMPGWQPSLHFWLQAAWVPRRALGFSAEIWTPLSAARLSEPEGSVELRGTSYRLGVFWELGANEGRASARLSAGWSLTALSVRGNADAPLVGRQDDFFSGGPWLGAGGRLRLSGRWAIWAQVSGTLALPRATIRLAGREVSDFARPASFAAFGPEVSWP